MVFLQVIFGHPLGLFPFGVHLNTILVIQFNILKTCPDQKKHLELFNLLDYTVEINQFYEVDV